MLENGNKRAIIHVPILRARRLLPSTGTNDWKR